MDNRPTPAQQRFLRVLAQRTSSSFVTPRTRAEASREIARLKELKPEARLAREDQLANWA